MERDTEEFIELLTGAQSPVFGYILSLCHNHAKAQDILQETNVTLWRKASDFEPGSNFIAWACRTAYFHALNHRRKASREQLVFDEDILDYLAERQEERASGTQDRVTILRGCLEKLPADQRSLIDQRYEPGASVQEMAREAGKSVGSVSQALFRIRATLQRCVEKQIQREEFA